MRRRTRSTSIIDIIVALLLAAAFWAFWQAAQDPSKIVDNPHPFGTDITEEALTPEATSEVTPEVTVEDNLITIETAAAEFDAIFTPTAEAQEATIVPTATRRATSNP